MPAPSPTTPRPWLLIPFLVLAVSLAITGAVAGYVSLAAAAQDRAQFENATERTQAAVQRRLEAYVNLLRGAAGLYAAQENKVVPRQFQAYVERLGLTDWYPGIQGIGVSGMAVGANVAGLNADMRKLGVRNFEVYPPGPRDEYHAVVLLEPQTDERNRQAIGYDMFTEPARRAAMEQARDTGNAATTGEVSLAAKGDRKEEAGFLIFVPIYLTITTPATLEQRRRALGGFIFSPCSAGELLEGVFGNERFPSGISFAVYDGDSATPGALLYRSDKLADADQPARDARFVKAAQLEVPGRNWTIAYASGPQFETRSARSFALLVLAAGGVVSVLLFALTAAQALARRRAERAAAELSRSEQETRAAKDSAERALAVAEQASELKDEFLATLSHELRTPLNAILGWSHVLLGERNNDRDELRQGLETIHRNAKAQARLIGDLLDVSRIVSGNLRLDVRAVRLGPIIEEAAASVRLAADAKGVRLGVSIDPNAGAVNGDETRLQQIVWNLLSNAVKFTPAGGSVDVALRQEGSEVRVTVTDTGIGISPEFRPHVFERFRQADASSTRRYGGLGLGLGIVRHLTELHGGTVHADSAGTGKGAAFTVAFPVSHAQAHARHVAPSGHADGPSIYGVRVLLVEDDDAARELIVRVLSGRGARVMSRASVADALQAFGESRPDVIVSDIGMPDEDGYALMERIRAMPPDAGGRVPAVALSALARAEDRQRALKSGFHVHVAKPFDPAELLAVIANLVGISRKEAARTPDRPASAV